MIPYARPKIFKKDIAKVNKVLNSQFLTTGPEIPKFENKLKKKLNSKYALTVNSATSALHLCCLAMGLSKNDYLWTSSITFVASANCGIYCGAKIDLIDIDDETLNISIDKLEDKLLIAKKKNKLPKIIIPVHLGGNPYDMKNLKRLSKVYKFKIIEDASHAIGATYNKIQIGSCKYSDACVFSFHPVKIITSGEGGAMLTNDKNLARKFSLLRSHGIVRKNVSKSSGYDWYYEQKNLGFNYRLNDIEAALGSSQLNKLNKFVKRRNNLAKYYLKNLNKQYIKCQQVNLKSVSSYHLFIIRTKPSLRKLIYENLKKNKIITSFHYIPIYRHPFYKQFKFNKKNFFYSEKYYKEGLSLPMYFGLTNLIQNKIIKVVNDTIKKNT